MPELTFQSPFGWLYRRISDWIHLRELFFVLFAMEMGIVEFTLLFHIASVSEGKTSFGNPMHDIVVGFTILSGFLFLLIVIAIFVGREEDFSSQEYKDRRDGVIMAFIFNNPLGILFYFIRATSPWLQKKTASWWWQDRKEKKERLRIELERINFVGDIISSNSDIAKEYKKRYGVELYDHMLGYQLVWTYSPTPGALARMFLEKSFVESFWEKIDVRSGRQELRKRILEIATWKLQQTLKIKTCLSESDDDFESAMLNAQNAEKILNTLLEIFKLYEFDAPVGKENSMQLQTS